ncbi:hypothetical protein ACHHYP_08177 [Achlya hypogyna]|uniref:Uncharacterized protein n=1 Tax=Achlya hypogyna TaxID=1202772 RepID=A0A1V9YPQ0_ACHHY|nr:hypothetical protein ACHHYP_08177 [Achlya hypogyna]
MAVEEHKAYQQQHGQRYLQLKSYTEKLEEELIEFKNKLATTNSALEEARESYKDKSRICRNYEKVVGDSWSSCNQQHKTNFQIKGLKSQAEASGQQRVMTAQSSGRLPLAMASSPKFAKSLSIKPLHGSSSRLFEQAVPNQHPAFAVQNTPSGHTYAQSAMTSRPSSSFRSHTSNVAPPPQGSTGVTTRSSKRRYIN